MTPDPTLAERLRSAHKGLTDAVEDARWVMAKADSDIAALTARCEMYRVALAFYADPMRYEGCNQKPIPEDSYGPPEFEYVWDVVRDQGDIARAALKETA